jgi:hypothetical protein
MSSDQQNGINWVLFQSYAEKRIIKESTVGISDLISVCNIVYFHFLVKALINLASRRL